MSQQKFVDRKEELKILNDDYSRKIIYNQQLTLLWMQIILYQ